MTFEAPITNCVDCNKTLPFFRKLIRCLDCNKKFVAMSKKEREKANREIEKRYFTEEYFAKVKEAPMQLKIKTRADLTLPQKAELQRLGCKDIPFIIRSHELIFAATCTSEQEQELKTLVYVASVEPMPTYGLASFQEG